MVSFEKRRLAAAEYNFRLLNGDVKPGMRVLWGSLQGNQRKPSLVLAMNDSMKCGSARFSSSHHQFCYRFLCRSSNGRLCLHPTHPQRHRFGLRFTGIVFSCTVV
ncbi:hypothetical protein DFS33DRAFT_678280 [Desarmillaria ectypa]|nr:hypothetical protein DFS33DRAFT_678280 [Desarmillaria ectypa]